MDVDTFEQKLCPVLSTITNNENHLDDIVDAFDIVAVIVNSSLQSGSVPESLKHAKVSLVRALLKKISLDSDNLSNYRPVSNLSFISKGIETCVHHQLLKTLKETAYFHLYSLDTRKITVVKLLWSELPFLFL